MNCMRHNVALCLTFTLWTVCVCPAVADKTEFLEDFESGKSAWSFYDGKAANPALPSMQTVTDKYVHSGKSALMGVSKNGCIDHLCNGLNVREENSTLSFWYFIPEGSHIGQIHVYVSSDVGRFLKIITPEKTNEWHRVSFHLAGEFSPELVGQTITGLEINGLGADTFILDDVAITPAPYATSATITKIIFPSQTSVGQTVEWSATLAASGKPITSAEALVTLVYADPSEPFSAGKSSAPIRDGRIGPVRFAVPEWTKPGVYIVKVKLPDVKVEGEPGKIQVRSKQPAPIAKPAFVLKNVNIPRQVNLGECFAVSCVFEPAVPSTEQKMFIQLRQGKILYFVANVVAGSTPQVDLPINIPTGDYDVYMGVHQCPPQHVGRVTVNDPHNRQAKRLGKPLGYGVYLDDRGACHFWYINHAGTLIWDGEPYLPVGGMIESHFLAYGPRPETWNRDLDAMKLIRSKGICDTYVNPPGRFAGQWQWQPLVDKLEELGFHYGIELSAVTPTDNPPDAYVVRMYQELSDADKDPNIIRAGNFMIDHVTKSGQYRLAKPLQFAPINTTILKANHVLYAIFDKTQSAMVKVGRGECSFKDNRLAMSATVALPHEGREYAIYFVPNITFAGPFANYWKIYEQISKSLPANLKKIRFGKNLRFFIDPTDNESGIYDSHAEFMFYFKEYQEQYARWLERKYGSISALNAAWAVRGRSLPDFTTAAALVPLQVGPVSSKWSNRAFLYAPGRDEIYELDYRVTPFWYDQVGFRHESYSEYQNRLGDAIKQAVNVPIVFKRAYGDNKYCINTWKSGGVDSIGAEDYGYGDRLTYIALEASAKCADSARTMWCLTTETHHEGGMHFDYTGYKSRADMAETFARQMAGGTKGIFHFLLHTSVGWNNHALVNDPKQLDWMKSFADAVQRKKDYLTNYQPAVYDSFPPAGMCWITPNDRTGFCRFDSGSYSVESDSGVWFTPTYDPLSRDSKLVLVSMEDNPAVLRHGPVFESLLRDKTRRIIFVGLRRNLGALSIDRYFTPKYKTLDGSTIQVLKPTRTSKILYQTASGDVWGLQDGPLQIIARSDAYTNLGGDPTVKYIKVQGQKLASWKTFLDVK